MILRSIRSGLSAPLVAHSENAKRLSPAAGTRGAADAFGTFVDNPSENAKRIGPTAGSSFEEYEAP